MIPYYRPYYNHHELLAALRPSPGREAFESELATRVGARYGIAFAYGRSALFAALKALGISQAEVVLPAYTCEVVAQAVVTADNRPRFVDIELGDFNMDIDALSHVLTPRTRSVVATHLFGYSADVDAIRDTIGDHRVILIEDCAQGLPLSPPDSHGLRGDLGLFSFGPGKPLSTVGGGMIITDSPDFYERIRLYRDKDMRRLSFTATGRRWARLLVSYLVFRKRSYGLWYRYRDRLRAGARPGPDPSSGTMPEDFQSLYAHFQARIGLVQLRKAYDGLVRRRALFELYDRELCNTPGIHTAPVIDDAKCTHYTLRIPDRAQAGFRQCMAQFGIATDQSYDYALPYLRPYTQFATDTYPRAAQAAREVVNLPCYPGLQMAQALYIANCVRTWASRPDRDRCM